MKLNWTDYEICMFNLGTQTLEPDIIQHHKLSYHAAVYRITELIYANQNLNNTDIDFIRAILETIIQRKLFPNERPYALLLASLKTRPWLT